jgi:hypothetical protein
MYVGKSTKTRYNSNRITAMSDGPHASAAVRVARFSP